MILVSVFINGYGNIGRRLASALSADKEFQFVGVAKYTVDEKVKEALDNHYNVFVPEEMIPNFKDEGYTVAGPVEEAVKQSDIVVDAAREGGGYENKKSLYEPMKKPAIFQ